MLRSCTIPSAHRHSTTFKQGHNPSRSGRSKLRPLEHGIRQAALKKQRDVGAAGCSKNRLRTVFTSFSSTTQSPRVISTNYLKKKRKRTQQNHATAKLVASALVFDRYCFGRWVCTPWPPWSTLTRTLTLRTVCLSLEALTTVSHWLVHFPALQPHRFNRHVPRR